MPAPSFYLLASASHQTYNTTGREGEGTQVAWDLRCTLPLISPVYIATIHILQVLCGGRGRGVASSLSGIYLLRSVFG